MMNILISLADMILLETPEDSKGLEILEGSTKDCPSYLYPYKYCVFQAPVQWCAWETFSPAECNNLPCSMTIILIDWISAILTVRSDPFQFLSFWHFFFFPTKLMVLCFLKSLIIIYVWGVSVWEVMQLDREGIRGIRFILTALLAMGPGKTGSVISHKLTLLESINL